jgi:threonine dehydratase
MNPESDIIHRILGARVYDVARETDLDLAPKLSERLGASVWLKREDLQPVFCFKLRGAYNKIARLAPEDAARGIFAASAGNHAQGVALAAARKGYRATIVMPRTTPEIKVRAVVALGAEVVLHGDTYDEAREEAERRLARSGGVFVHPFDDLDVIAGQGTVGVEILRQHPDPIDAIFVPVGGGGLLAGVQSFVKYLRPETEVIAVEPEDAACLQAALRAGRPVPLDHVGIFADGTAVKQVGDHPFRLVREKTGGVVTVNVDEICAAILDLFEDTRVVAEPSGALAVAGMKKWLAEKGGGGAGRAFVAIVSGANINFHRLRHISERAELGEEREAIFAVTIPERPGSFRALCAALGDRFITEFNYRLADENEAHVFVGVELRRGGAERRELAASLRAAGYAVNDMTGNELAVLHTRHMVGGRAPSLDDERLLRFEFPERPGALGRFLALMSPGWNLTLFHYRNHGGAVGRVLAGIQVPDAERGAFDAYLAELGYPWVEETENEAYRLFLR